MAAVSKHGVVGRGGTGVCGVRRWNGGRGGPAGIPAAAPDRKGAVLPRIHRPVGRGCTAPCPSRTFTCRPWRAASPGARGAGSRRRKTPPHPGTDAPGEREVEEKEIRAVPLRPSTAVRPVRSRRREASHLGLCPGRPLASNIHRDGPSIYSRIRRSRRVQVGLPSALAGTQTSEDRPEETGSRL